MTTLRDELARLYEDEGRLTPALVLDAARPEDSPLHSWFEWDDAIAGEEFRRSQARLLIRRVRVQFTSGDGEEKQVRRYHALRTAADVEFEYHDADDIRRNPLMRKLLLRQMERDISQLVSRYEDVQEFWQILAKHRRRKRA